MNSLVCPVLILKITCYPQSKKTKTRIRPCDVIFLNKIVLLCIQVVSNVSIEMFMNEFSVLRVLSLQMSKIIWGTDRNSTHADTFNANFLNSEREMELNLLIFLLQSVGSMPFVAVPENWKLLLLYFRHYWVLTYTCCLAFKKKKKCDHNLVWLRYPLLSQLKAIVNLVTTFAAMTTKI